MLLLSPPAAPTPLSYYRIRSIQDKVDGVYYWLKASRTPQQQALFADLKVARNLLCDLPVLLAAERAEADRRWQAAIQALSPKRTNESIGWSEINEDHPQRHHFESHETGVGCYEFHAEFHFVRGPRGDQLNGVTITDARRLEEEELVEVTNPAEFRLLACEAETWWEARQ
ncbi:hypothetical protein LOC68_09765 [Blastopirellula sp. JC732]|uniref:Uncharacterized protein n=1 Tax=Blastopirellula sediminis TaxID=2894196 RepID=A0A9X1MNF8_9BACT|nr:hypothetical protein [Blastopirellula sediminis]MCC9608539.1 hypothetical protein [Blastopirellula sediminis]MCC9628684.1 hypothetical protein [Blastopirellula sediminis]